MRSSLQTPNSDSKKNASSEVGSISTQCGQELRLQRKSSGLVIFLFLRFVLQALECALTLSALRNLSRDEVAMSPLHFKVNDVASPEISISRKKRQDNSGLHSGKWSPEENNYANCMVAHFRHGSLRIPNGSTLRAFLAEKLGCVSCLVLESFSLLCVHAIACSLIILPSPPPSHSFTSVLVGSLR